MTQPYFGQDPPPLPARLAHRLGEMYTELGDLTDRLDQARAERDETQQVQLEARLEIVKRDREIFAALIMLRNHFEPSLWKWLADQFEYARFLTLIKARELPAYVMSIDIRRSTQLMLNATRPEAFADFILSLCTRLRGVIWENHGIFEKFTGDGILACFPPAYSGPAAAQLVLRASTMCQEVFASTYRDFRDNFHVLTTGTGIGIGVDYGPIYLAPALSGLTIVGRPVVYACRLAGGESGQILFNHQAFKQMNSSEKVDVSYAEARIKVKNDSDLIAYDVRWNLPGRPVGEHAPGWEGYLKQFLASEGSAPAMASTSASVDPSGRTLR